MSNKIKAYWLAVSVILSCTEIAYASPKIEVPVYKVAASGQGERIGTVTLEDSFCGVLVTPQLTGLTPGAHGFHVHVNPDCGNNGLAAGGHLDPAKTDKHDGPYNKHGHMGDMPVLIVNQDGTANLPTLAPRFKLANIKGHSIVIHAGGDNYSDQPQKLGGGGERIACGVIPTK